MRASVLYLCLIVFLGTSVSTLAQRNSNIARKRKAMQNVYGIWKFTGGVGTSSYQGDLGSPGLVKGLTFRPNAYLGAQYRISSRFSLRAEGGYYGLSATDVGGKNPQRNLQFRSNNFEAYVAGQWDTFEFSRRFRRTAPPIVNPFGFAGIGFTTVSPQGELAGATYSLRQYKTEDKSYSPITLTIPLGVGLRFRVLPMMDVSLEMSYRLTLSDYLDDVSTTYISTAGIDPIRAGLANKEIIPSSGEVNPEDITGKKRGDPSRTDGYLNFGIKLEFNTVSSLNNTSRRTKQKGVRRTPRFRN